jgi:hypothetical protein
MLCPIRRGLESWPDHRLVPLPTSQSSSTQVSRAVIQELFLLPGAVVGAAGRASGLFPVDGSLSGQAGIVLGLVLQGAAWIASASGGREGESPEPL